MTFLGFLFRSTSKKQNKDSNKKNSKKNNKKRNIKKKVKKSSSNKSLRKNKKNRNKVGGGFVIDVGQGASIGGQAPRHGYSECCPPMYHKGDIAYTTNGNQLCGGGKRNVKSKRTKNKRKLSLKRKISPKKH